MNNNENRNDVQNHALRSANAEKGYTALERAKKEKNEVEINLADVFQILLSKWIYILIAGLVVVPLVSLVTKKPDRSYVDEIFTCYEQTVTVHKRTSLEEDN